MSKKKCNIYCLLPRTASEPLSIESLYRRCIGWHDDYAVVYQYAKESYPNIGWDILLGNKKSFQKYDPEGFENYELQFIDRQWMPYRFAEEAWESIMTEYKPYDEAIGVLRMLIEDEMTDKPDKKILRKAIEVIKNQKELLVEPIDIRELEESHQLKEEWRNKVLE